MINSSTYAKKILKKIDPKSNILMRESGFDIDLESDSDPRHRLSRSDNPLTPSILDLDSSPSTRRLVIGDLMRRLDRGSRHLDDRDRWLESRHVEECPPSVPRASPDPRGPPPPEWALLLVGCLLGLATGVLVATFNILVHVIHEWAWAGTPNDGASWLRLQRPADTWHRVLLIPVTGGVVVGMIHGLLEISHQLKSSKSSGDKNIDWIAGIFPIIKAIQAAITLGTGCSLGPEGPSVDIGKSCAKGCSAMIENNRERRIALVAAGAAAGIASGFNAAVAGCFFAIETVLRPLRAENSPPFTTAMIILASVVSSTVSSVLLGEKPAFTVPTYELKSAAGMLCGAASLVFTRLVAWFTKSFKYIKERFGLPAAVCPSLGGLGAGLIALRYPGILYWGFTNVDEILHTEKTAAAPGMWLLVQLSAAKVVATALCKGSGLVGGVYAPSLMIGAAIGAVFGILAGELINSAIPGPAAIAQPQAYALVGMAATLASVCSVPLTSVLLLFELTKDYRILLPLMGAVGLAIWVPSVVNHHDEESLDMRSPEHSFSSRLHVNSKNDIAWRRLDRRDDLELSTVENDIENQDIQSEEALLDDLKVFQAMSKSYIKVLPTVPLRVALKLMHENRQTCVFVVDEEDYLEGILTVGDIRRRGSETMIENSSSPKGDSTISSVKLPLVSSCFTRGFQFQGSERGLLVCFPDSDLTTAKELMEAKGIKQLPVVKRGADLRSDRKRRIIGLLRYESINYCLREHLERRNRVSQGNQDVLREVTTNGH